MPSLNWSPFVLRNVLTAAAAACSNNNPQVRLPTTRTPSLYSDFRPRNSGVLRRGEMILVLGAPESGYTTFLEVITNECGTYTNVTGVSNALGFLVQRCSNTTKARWFKPRR